MDDSWIFTKLIGPYFLQNDMRYAPTFFVANRYFHTQSNFFHFYLET